MSRFLLNRLLTFLGALFDCIYLTLSNRLIKRKKKEILFIQVDRARFQLIRLFYLLVDHHHPRTSEHSTQISNKQVIEQSKLLIDRHRHCLFPIRFEVALSFCSCLEDNILFFHQLIVFHHHLNCYYAYCISIVVVALSPSSTIFIAYYR